MRCWLRVLVVAVLLAAVGLAGWCCVNRRQLARQWGCYRVAAAGSFRQAQAEIARFENAPDRHAQVAELVRKWGTGNQRFDLYLAAHVTHPASSETLREIFSEELDRRRRLAPRWAHYWSWRAPLEPDRQVASVVDYLDTLFRSDRPGTITWREVLDLRAVFHLTGQPQRGRGLSPTNWQDHYRVWQETRPAKLPHFTRPKKPFADWQGALGELADLPDLRADAAGAGGEEVAGAAVGVVGIGDRSSGRSGREVPGVSATTAPASVPDARPARRRIAAALATGGAVFGSPCATADQAIGAASAKPVAAAQPDRHGNGQKYQ